MVDLDDFFPMWKASLALMAAALVFCAGWTVRDWKADADRVAVLEAHAEAVRQSIEFNKRVHGELAAALEAERTARAAEKDDFKEKLRHAQPRKLVSCTQPKPKPTPAPRPGGNGPGETRLVGGPAVPAPTAEPADDAGVRFTGKFVGLWNDGLAIGAAEADRAGRPDGATEGAGVADPRDIVANVGDNGERLNACLSVARSWQTWACKHGFATEAQCSKL